jgi:hypothetical protein
VRTRTQPARIQQTTISNPRVSALSIFNYFLLGIIKLNEKRRKSPKTGKNEPAHKNGEPAHKNGEPAHKRGVTRQSVYRKNQ